MDKTDHPFSGSALLLRLGGHSFAAHFLVTFLAMTAAAVFGPALMYAFGTGWGAPLLLVLALFGFLLLFRRFIFHSLYPKEPGDGDAALLEYLVQQSPGQTPAEEEMSVELLENALHLNEVRAYDCMAPRPEIVHIDVSASIEDLRRLFIESSMSRIVVTEGGIDHVLGYVHVQQLFDHPTIIRAMVMPMTFVPETIPINDLLQKFIKRRNSIACVVDEYGSVAGLVTLENALEQLFGDIDDEHDQEEFIEVQLSPNEFLFSGRLEIDYLNERYPNLHLPEGDYNTLSGYIVTIAQTIPEQGARLEIQGKIFVLELVSDRKIETVRVLG